MADDGVYINDSNQSQDMVKKGWKTTSIIFIIITILCIVGIGILLSKYLTLQDESKTLKDNLDASAAKLKSTQNSLNTALQEKADCETKYSQDINAKNIELNKLNGLLKDANDKYKQDMDAINTELNNLKSSSSILSNTVNTLQDRINNLNGMVSGGKMDFESTKYEIEKIKTLIGNIQSSTDYENITDTLKQNIRNIVNKVNNLNDSISNYKDKLIPIEQKISQNEQSAINIIKEVKDLEPQKAATDVLFSQLKKLYDTLKVDNTLTTDEAKITSAQNIVDKYKKTLEDVRSSLEMKSPDLSNNTLSDISAASLARKKAYKILQDGLNALYNAASLDPTITDETIMSANVKEMVDKYIQNLTHIRSKLSIDKSINDTSTSDINAAYDRKIATATGCDPAASLKTLITNVNNVRDSLSSTSVRPSKAEVKDTTDYTTLTTDNIEKFVKSSIAYLNQISAGLSTPIKNFNTFNNLIVQFSNDLTSSIERISKLENWISVVFYELRAYPALKVSTTSDNPTVDQIINPSNRWIDNINKYLQYRTPDKNTIPVSYLRNTILYNTWPNCDGRIMGNEDNMSGWNRIDNPLDNSAIIMAYNGSFDDTINHTYVYNTCNPSPGTLVRDEHTYNTYVISPYNSINKSSILGYDSNFDTFDLEKVLANGVAFDHRSVVNPDTLLRKDAGGNIRACQSNCALDKTCAAVQYKRGNTNVTECSYFGKGARIGGNNFNSFNSTTYVPPGRANDITILPF